MCPQEGASVVLFTPFNNNISKLTAHCCAVVVENGTMMMVIIPFLRIIDQARYTLRHAYASQDTTIVTVPLGTNPDGGPKKLCLFNTAMDRHNKSACVVLPVGPMPCVRMQDLIHHKVKDSTSLRFVGRK